MIQIASSVLLALALAVFGSPAKAETFEEYRCWNYTKVAVYMNDKGTQRRFERVEYNSPYCGASQPTLNVVVDNTYGDRFKPVRVDVQYFNMFGGRSSNWQFEVTRGRAEKVGHELHIYREDEADDVSDYFTITTPANLTWDDSYQLKPEARCESTFDGDTWRDCTGAQYFGRKDGLIYYGEDDTQIVEWEIAFNITDTRAEDTVVITKDDPDPYYRQRYEYIEGLVERYNDIYENNGIFIRYVIAGVAISPYGGISSTTQVIWSTFNADVGLGLNATCPNTCGCAYPGTRFQENSGRAQIGVSVCSFVVDLHEIGHAVGLAHGPENSANEGYGYIFPEFGHGWSTPFCGPYIDIMSYGGMKTMHHNSRITCEAYKKLRPNQYLNPEIFDDPHGNREYADAAYALNRVRYDVSLISRVDPDAEFDWDRAVTEDLGDYPDAAPIEDHVEHYENAPEMIRERQRTFKRLGETLEK